MQLTCLNSQWLPLPSWTSLPPCPASAPGQGIHPSPTCLQLIEEKCRVVMGSQTSLDFWDVKVHSNFVTSCRQPENQVCESSMVVPFACSLKIGPKGSGNLMVTPKHFPKKHVVYAYTAGHPFPCSAPSWHWSVTPGSLPVACRVLERGAGAGTAPFWSCHHHWGSRRRTGSRSRRQGAHCRRRPWRFALWREFEV